MEALAAIFDSQFTLNEPNKCTVVAIPNADQVYLSCSLEWTMPPKYPEVVPELTVHNVKGLDQTWQEELKTRILESAKDMTGGPMIFSLVEIAREWLTERNVAGVGEGSMYARMMAKEHEKQRAETKQQQQQQQHQVAVSKSGPGGSKKKVEQGTPVTLESFTKWVTTFIKEEAASQPITEQSSKLTGRQQFEKGNMRPEEDEVVGGDVEDFDLDLILDEEVDLDALDDDGEDEQEEA